jgi:hypothetical protein
MGHFVLDIIQEIIVLEKVPKSQSWVQLPYGPIEANIHATW